MEHLTAVHSRFHVGCGNCGFVEAYKDRTPAMQHAESHFHDAEVSVFDSMARHGATELRHFDGSHWHVGSKRS
jgi:hypothetical protein